MYKEEKMFCLLQVMVSELPFIPEEIKGIKFLTLFFSQQASSEDWRNGEGWVIREYDSLRDLELLTDSSTHSPVKSFPIRWSEVEDDAPGWENSWELLDMSPINETKGADEKFFFEYNRYTQTKFGGFPDCVQHEANLDGFVFQIGSEDKANWSFDGSIHFNRNKNGEWSVDSQFT